MSRHRQALFIKSQELELDAPKKVKMVDNC